MIDVPTSEIVNVMSFPQFGHSHSISVSVIAFNNSSVKLSGVAIISPPSANIIPYVGAGDNRILKKARERDERGNKKRA